MKKLKELILHCLDDRSDKVYILEIFEKSDFFFLSASWGRRDVISLASQMKGRFVSLDKAQCEMNRLANKKKKKGYAIAAVNLQIPGHTSAQYEEENVNSGNLMVETRGDVELGTDDYGNSLRSII